MGMSRTLKADPQITELRAKHLLFEDIIRSNLEYAIPGRDDGTDLIVYRPADFLAAPIQLKSSETSRFGLWKKYEQAKRLILAYVWLATGEIYLTTYDEALQIVKASGWHETPSWKEGGGYSSNAPSKLVCKMLERYRSSPARWAALLTGGM